MLIATLKSGLPTGTPYRTFTTAKPPKRIFSRKDYEGQQFMKIERCETVFPIGIRPDMDEFANFQKTKNNNHRHFAILSYDIDGKEYQRWLSSEKDFEAIGEANRMVENFWNFVLQVANCMNLYLGTQISGIRLSHLPMTLYVSVLRDTYHEETGEICPQERIKGYDSTLSRTYRWGNLELLIPVKVSAFLLALSTIFFS
jgi:hypothetical protein